MASEEPRNVAPNEQQVPKAAALRNFFARVHEKGETWDEYACALRALSEPCDFGEMKEAFIRNRFVSGIRDESLRHLQYLKQAGCCTSLPEQDVPEDFSRHAQKTENVAETKDQVKTQKKISPIDLRFKKTSGAADGAGEEFEWQMLTLVYLRLLHSGSEFYIGSNMAAAGLFDDIVVKYRADSEQPWSTAMLQLKRKKNKIIPKGALLTLKDDFSLVKYCDSYCKMKSSNDNDLQFFGEFGDHQFIIFTNSCLHDNLVNQADTNAIFTTGGDVVQLRKEQIVDELCEWNDLKLVLSLLKDQVKGKSEEVVSIQIKEMLSGLPKYKNKVINSTIKFLIENASIAKLEDAMKNLQTARDRKSHEDFLSNLQFYTNQAHDTSLVKKVKQCVAKTINLSDSSKTDHLFEELIEKMKNWWKKENFYLTQDSSLWLEIIRSQIKKLSAKKDEAIKDYKIGFIDTSVDIMQSKIPRTSGGILNVIVESRTTASSIKVMAALARFGEEENILFVDVATLLHREEEVIGLWSSRWCRILVVECDTELDQKDIGRLSNKIINVVEGEEQKKLFVCIGREQNRLTENLDNLDGYKSHKDSCEWCDLTETSREHLLTINVDLQDAEYPLQVLVNENKKFEERVNADLISQLILDEIRCGKKLELVDEIFIPRRLRASDGISFSVDSVRDVVGKVVLVVAEPGMGKSTLATNLALSAKAEYPTTWVVHVRLIDCTQHLATMDLKNFNPNAAKKLLEKIALGCTNSLEIALFRSLEDKLIVFIDGVDEVCPHYELQALQFLRCLINLNVKQLWVTSLTIMRPKLEAILSVTAHVLEPFSLRNQHDFFAKSWKHKIPNTPDEKLNAYTETLLAALSSKLENFNPIWEVPLMAAMVVEVFEEDLRLFLLHDKQGIFIRLDLLSLYDTFMQKKFDRYYTEKKKDDEKTRQLAAHIDDEEKLKLIFYRNHRLAALRFFFSASEISALQFPGCADFDTNLAEFLEQVANGREKRGIIDNISSDGTLHFVHRTFASYFVASWLSENFKGNEEFMKRIIFDSSYTWMLDMFNRFLVKDQPLHRAVLNRGVEEAERVLTADSSKCNSLDVGGRTPLHLAVLLSNTKHGLGILQMLLQHKARVDVADNVLGWRPLQYADRVQAWTAAGMILAAGGNEDDMPTIKSIKQPARQAFIEFIKQPLRAAPELSLMLAAARDAGLPVVRYLVEERRGDVQCRGSRGETMLHMAAEGGDVEVLQYLHAIEPPLQFEDSDLTSPLHYATLQGHIGVVRFLLERGLDLDAVDGHGETCLQIAARRGDYDLMEILVKEGASYEVNLDMELTEKQRNVTLLCAAFDGNLETVRLLVEMGTSTEHQDGKGKAAIEIALSRGHSSIVEFLLLRDCPDGQAKLHCSCRLGQRSAVLTLLSQGANVNEVDDKGYTPIQIAANEGNIEIVKLLIENGASLASDKNGNTLLHRLAMKGKVEMISLLLQQEIDINAINNNGRTALSLASLSNRVDVVKLLVERGASMVGNSDGYTPLIIAAMFGNLEVVSYLIDHVDDINEANTTGRTALALASHSGELEVVKLLVSKGATMIGDKNDITPLHHAAIEGRAEVVSFLVQRVKDINEVNNIGRSALSLASLRTHLEVVRLLIENGDSMEEDTPLHITAYAGIFDGVSFLLDHIDEINSLASTSDETARALASLNDLLNFLKSFVDKVVSMAGDQNKESPQHLAPTEDMLAIALFLIQHIKDINVLDENRQTALTLASYNGRVEVVKVLVEQGASMVGDKDGDSPLHLASRQGNVEVVSYLVQHVEDINSVNISGHTSLALASYNGYLEIVKILVENGSKMIRDPNGETPLHFSASQGKLKVVSYLVQQYVEDINAVNISGHTALALASCKGNLDVVKVLVYNGARMVGDKDGELPLHLASREGRVEVVTFLLKHTDNINAKSNKGRTALLLASNKGHLEVVKLLVDKKASMIGDRECNVPLHSAAREGKTDVVAFLLERVEDINVVKQYGRTALYLASYYGHLEVVKVLVAGGASMMGDVKGNTPLHVASREGKLDVVVHLVQHVEDVDVCNNVGETPLSLATAKEHLDIVKVLVDKDAEEEKKGKKKKDFVRREKKGNSLLWWW